MADLTSPGTKGEEMREALISAGAYALALISANEPWKSAEPNQQWQRFSYPSAEAAAKAWSKGDPERARAEVVVAALLAGPLAQLQSDRTRLQQELAAVDLAFEGLEETDRARRIGHWIGLAAAETTRANAAEAELASLRAKTAGGAEEMRERAAQTAITAVTILNNSACSLAMERALDIAGKKIRSLPLDPSPQSEGGGE